MSIRRGLARTAATAALAIGLSTGVCAVASATIATFPVQVVTESASGFQGSIPGSDIVVASDGEVTFDPFGAGFDTSDGIQLTSGWLPVTSTGSFGPGLWQQVGTTNTWVLPAVITGCGSENEPTCEPVGEWFHPDFQWGVDNKSLEILDSDGVTLSDLVIIANNGPEGTATITFASDPIGVPEPTTWALMLIGLFGLGATLRSARRGHALVAA